MSITTMIDYEDAKRSKPFPKLMENTMNKDIALFTKEKHGTLLKSTCLEEPIGTTSDKWWKEEWVDFNGTIKLKND